MLLIMGVGGESIPECDSWPISRLTVPERVRGDNNFNVVLINRKIGHNT